MPTIHVNGTELWYEDSGGSAAAILFSHGLLLSARQFDRRRRRSESISRIAYDHRGQGRSAPSKLRSIDPEILTTDAIALIEALGLAPVHFCGHSMGGYVGMRLAARRPEFVRSLTCLTRAPTRSHPITRHVSEDELDRSIFRDLVGHRRDDENHVRPHHPHRPSTEQERRAWRRALQTNRRAICAP